MVVTPSAMEIYLFHVYSCRFSSNISHTLFSVASAVAVDFLLIGAVICTVGW